MAWGRLGAGASEVAGHTGCRAGAVAVRPRLVWLLVGDLSAWTGATCAGAAATWAQCRCPSRFPLGCCRAWGESTCPVPLIVFFKSRGAGGSPGELRGARPEAGTAAPLGPSGPHPEPYLRAQGCRRLPRSSEVGTAPQLPCCGVTQGLLLARAQQGRQNR